MTYLQAVLAIVFGSLGVAIFVVCLIYGIVEGLRAGIDFVRSRFPNG